jgi:hypothetical protein
MFSSHQLLLFSTISFFEEQEIIPIIGKNEKIIELNLYIFFIKKLLLYKTTGVNQK